MSLSAATGHPKEVTKAPAPKPTGTTHAPAAVHAPGMSAGPKVTTVKPVVKHGESVATATATKETVKAAHDGEIGKRLQQAGAVVGAITCSLVWDNTDVSCLPLFFQQPSLSWKRCF